ncbi:MAG: 30S ribosomal protein S11 [Flavobacteriales bacterium]|nr:30S ribosomal protein S11 [Flavobacteriales bacterium]MCX7768020.1 30S ribosomal protein S11 [Flavobacteriales bacterium]MDW8409225.1 30S ribosomal protein S11 [Flavobacteriales bacterium]
MAKSKTSKKKVKVDLMGQCHINATFNNIIITFTNNNGEVIAWSSAGKMGFKGSKKNTPYAAQVAALDVAKTAYDLGVRRVRVFVKGPGAGRESAIRTIAAFDTVQNESTQDSQSETKKESPGIEIVEIIDVTPIPHNGCRPPKRRRI